MGAVKLQFFKSMIFTFSVISAQNFNYLIFSRFINVVCSTVELDLKQKTICNRNVSISSKIVKELK